jgi:hypothetical protein
MTGPWVQTSVGGAYDFLTSPAEPDVEATRETVSHALAQLCRFTGHTPYPYSVAEHCVLAAQHWGRTDEEKLALLVHDAHEAYMGDVPSPVLACLPLEARQAIKELKLRLDAAICASLCHKHQHALVGMMRSALVRDADTRILLDERLELHALPPQPWDIDEMGFEPLGVTIKYWDRVHCQMAFVGSFEKLATALQEPW